MTIENSIKRLREYATTGNKKAYEDMKAHILKSKKFQGNPIISELTEVKEEKQDGKKSKR